MFKTFSTDICLEKYLKCSVWRLAVWYDIYIYIYIYIYDIQRQRVNTYKKHEIGLYEWRKKSGLEGGGFDLLQGYQHPGILSKTTNSFSRDLVTVLRLEKATYLLQFQIVTPYYSVLGRKNQH
jgi:hypothetical protein